MSNEIQRFEFKGASLRALTDEAGEPWFVAKDACDILGNDTNHLREALDDDEITNLRNSEVWNQPGRAPLIISEPGLYKLIMRSRKPEAKEFQRWVTHEVLPQIRKTGGYIPTTDADDDMTILAKAVMIGQRTMEAQKQRIAEQQTRIVELEPKARFADAVAASDGTCLIGELAKMLPVRDSPAGRIPRQDRLEPQRSDPEGHGLGTVPNQGNRHHPFGRPRDHQPHREGHRQRPDILHQPLLPTRRP